MFNQNITTMGRCTIKWLIFGNFDTLYKSIQKVFEMIQMDMVVTFLNIIILIFE